MKYHNIFDSHTHSKNSFDGNHSCMDICEWAILNGGKGIAITDHCDIDGDDYDLDKQYNDASAAKEKFDSKIKVFKGIELGQGIYRPDKTSEALAKYDYDIVIGSIHNLENEEDFYFLDYEKVDINSFIQRYFSDLLKLSSLDIFDTLAHITYPFRYMYKFDAVCLKISDYYEIINEIFLSLIKNKKALELNVSGLYHQMNDTLPPKELIRRFHELGGKYVTVGTDSHYKEKMCVGIDRGYDILKECGFNQFTIFENREPVLIDIE